MRVFKTTYKDKKTGTAKPGKNWYIELKDHLNVARRFTGFPDKGQSLALGRKINKLVNAKLSGEPLDRELTEWLDCISNKLRDRLHDVGLLNTKQAAARRLLKEHLEDFHQFLLAKGNTPEYCQLTYYRVKRICSSCRFTYWSDISASDVQFYIADLRERGQISQKTSNYYLQAVKYFASWMVRDRRASRSPLEYLQPMEVTEVTRRRALGETEVVKLLDATIASPKRFRMSGCERVVLYRLAVESGLRALEIRSLTVASFNFQERTVVVLAENAKNRRGKTLPLRRSMCGDLKPLLQNKLPQTKAFNLPSKYNMARMLKKDLDAAGIDWADHGDGKVDFHSLRHTTGSLLAASGAHPKVAQSIMRHSDINLTMSRYTHVLREQESQAIENLPDFSKQQRSDRKHG